MRKTGKHCLPERLPCRAHPWVHISCIPPAVWELGPWLSGITAFGSAPKHQLAALLPAKSQYGVSDFSTFLMHSCQKPALRTNEVSLPSSLLPFLLERMTCVHLLKMLMHVNIQYDIFSHIKASKERRKEGRENNKTTRSSDNHFTSKFMARCTCAQHSI